MPDTFRRLHAWARSRPWLARFTLANRILLAMAFLPTGLVKLTGQRFTILDLEHPVGFFFEAMYRTGPYWIFIGGVQVLAALLLLVPRTALLGALLFTPVAASIFLITVGVGFQGTVWITGGMVLSVGWLLLWDADRLVEAIRPLLKPPGRTNWMADAHPVERVGWTGGALLGMGVFLATRGFVPSGWVRAMIVGGLVAVVLVVVGWILGARAAAREAGS